MMTMEAWTTDSATDKELASKAQPHYRQGNVLFIANLLKSVSSGECSSTNDAKGSIPSGEVLGIWDNRSNDLHLRGRCNTLYGKLSFLCT